MTDLKVGDKIYYVPNDRRNTPKWMQVEKIGRRWAELEYNKRMSLATWEMDGGANYSSPGRCYRSMQDYDAEVIRNRRWANIRDHFSLCTSAPDGVDLDAVERALGMK